MKFSVRNGHALHAAFSVAAFAFIGFVIFVAGVSVVGGILGKRAALQARTESVSTLTAKLDEMRAAANLRLIQIGATPEDIDIIAEPARMRELLSRACVSIMEVETAECPIEEAAIAAGIARYRSRITIAGATPRTIMAIESSVVRPLILSALTIRPAAGQTEIALVIEIIGAQSAETPP